MFERIRYQWNQTWARYWLRRIRHEQIEAEHLAALAQLRTEKYTLSAQKYITRSNALQQSIEKRERDIAESRHTHLRTLAAQLRVQLADLEKKINTF